MSSRKRPSDSVIVHPPMTNDTTLHSFNSNSTSDAMDSNNNNIATKELKLRVRIKAIQAVAHWTWNANDDVCGICQSAFEGTAPGVKYPGEDCPVVWGQCGHAFHLQCISQWLSSAQSKNTCPICRQDWDFGQNPVNNNNNTNAQNAASGATT